MLVVSVVWGLCCLAFRVDVGLGYRPHFLNLRFWIHGLVSCSARNSFTLVLRGFVSVRVEG